jgi:hypothetical protein
MEVQEMAWKEPCTSMGETQHIREYCSILGESFPASEMQDSEVGDDNNLNRLIRGGTPLVDEIGREVDEARHICGEDTSTCVGY